MVTEEAHLVQKYERVQFSPLDMALLARRFAPRLAPPLTKPLASSLPPSRFARNFRVNGLWSPESFGTFCSLDGPAMDLHKTRERVFEPSPKQFTECRGVILEDVNNPEDNNIRLPARFVVFGVGECPNSEWLGDGLDTTAGGYVKVNENCETSVEGVYAIGDVAVVERGGGAEGYARTGHVDAARKMASHVAKVVKGEFVEAGGMDHVPYYYSRVLELSWKFWGSSDCNEIVTIGLGGGEDGEGPEGKTWASFYVREGVVVGVLLNNGSEEQISKCERFVRARAEVLNTKKLEKCSVDEILGEGLERRQAASVGSCLMLLRTISEGRQFAT